MLAPDDQLFKIVDDAVRRLEDSWRTASGANLQDLVPPPDSPAHYPCLLTLIKIDQEFRWKAGQRRLLEDYLGDWSEWTPSKEQLQELLQAEFRIRASAGEPPTADELRDRFPDIASKMELAAILAEAENENLSGSDDAQHDTSNMHGPTHTSRQPSDDCPELQPGDRLGRCEIERKLSRGGMASIYLARHTELDSPVAVKVPHRGIYESSEQVQLFLNEGRLAFELQHPAIVRVHHADRQPDGTCYLVMDYIEGKTLAELLEQDKVTREEAITWIARLAEALQYAHQRQVIHRDVKPANILIDKQGNPHLTDFGLAVHETVQQHRAGELSGTLPYMSPEQIRGEVHRQDGRADIWSLGVVLYELLTGRRPFSGDTVKQMGDEIMYREPKPPSQIDPTISESLERICLKCLKKSADERYSHGGDLSRDLRAEQQTQQPRRSRRRWLVGAIAAAVLLLSASLLLQPWTMARMTPLSCERMDVLVWNPKPEMARMRMSVEDERTLPLQPGDLVRVEVELNREAYPYLFLIDTSGAVTPVYPWVLGSWEKRPEKEKPTRRVSLPADLRDGWPVTGPQGMDTLVLLARDSPLPRDFALRESLTGLPSQGKQDSKAFVEFNNWQPRVPAEDGRLRGLVFDTERIGDPVLETQSLLQQRLESHFDLHRALSFANEAE